MKYYWIPFVTFLLFAFYGNDRVFGQTLQVPAVPIYVQPAYAIPYYAPPVIYQPQVQWVPYQYQGSQVYRRYYRTPVRNLLFGKYRAYDYLSLIHISEPTRLLRRSRMPSSA